MSNNNSDSATKVEAAITFLMKVRFATAEQIYRVMYGKELKPSATVWTRVFKKAMDAGYILKTTPLLSKTLYYAAPHTEVLSAWPGMRPASLERSSVSLQAHSLAVSSLLSQIMTAPDGDALGAGAQTWSMVRPFIQDGQYEMIGETQMQSAWAASKDYADDAERAQTFSGIDEVVRMADEATWQKEPESLWAWVTACNGKSWQRNDNSYQDATFFVDNPKDGSYALRDHVPDAVVNLQSQNHWAIALEMELTTKTVTDYVRTLAAFQSELGLAQYQKVVWLYDRTTTGTYLRRALEIVGNKHEQIVLRRIRTKDASGTRVWSGADIEILPDNPVPHQTSTSTNQFAALLQED